jgi:hypothetical protein
MRMNLSKEDLIIIRECMYSVTLKGKDARLFGLLLDKIEKTLEDEVTKKEKEKDGVIN